MLICSLSPCVHLQPIEKTVDAIEKTDFSSSSILVRKGRRQYLYLGGCRWRQSLHRQRQAEVRNLRRMTQQPQAPAPNASADKALQGQIGSGGLGGVAATGRLRRRGGLRRWLDGTGAGGFDWTPMQMGRRRRDGTGRALASAGQGPVGGAP